MFFNEKQYAASMEKCFCTADKRRGFVILHKTGCENLEQQHIARKVDLW